MTHASLSTYQAIPVAAIKPSPYQARKEFDEESLAGLAASMKQEGLIEPIVVRLFSKEKFELISGERRLRAAKLLGWKFIEAKIIATKSEGEAAIKGLIENLQRQDLNPIEEAEGFRELLAIGKIKTQRALAGAVGKKEAYVSRSLSLLGLCHTAIENLRQRKFSREHGIELLRILDKNQQKTVTHKVGQNGWSVKETRQEIDFLLSKKGGQMTSRIPKVPVPLVDPLAKVWEPLRMNGAFAPDVAWDVQYKDYAIVPGKGSMEGWVFFAKPIVEENSAKALAFWLRQLATALEGKKPQKVESEILKEAQDITATMENIAAKPRLPKNAKEMKELEDIAARGTPQDVYAWIYGKDHMLARGMSYTWEQMQMPPKKAVRFILDGLRQLGV